MSLTIGPDIIESESIRITSNASNELVVVDRRNGGLYRYDSGLDAWYFADGISLGDDFDVGGNDVNAVSALEVDEVNIEQTNQDPTTSGEIRRDGTDVKIHSGGAVKNISNIGTGSGGSGSPGGSSEQIQFNDSGSFGGVDQLEYDGYQVLHQANVGGEQVSNYGRPLVSAQGKTLYVDPNNGDDTVRTQNVTDTNPLETIQEALDRVPLILQHEWVIDLATAPSLPVTYPASAPSNTLLTGPHVMMGHSFSGKSGQDLSTFSIIGDMNDRTNVTIDQLNFSFHITDSEIEDRQRNNLHSVTLNGSIQCKGGKMGLKDCVFTGQNKDVAVAGKNASVWMEDCKIENPCKEVVDASHDMRAYILRCSGNPSEYIADVRGGGRVVDRGNSTDLRADLGAYKTYNGGSVVVPRGVFTEGALLTDDFGDTDLTDRVRPPSSGGTGGRGMGGYRPDWGIIRGSPEISNGSLLLPGGSNNDQWVLNDRFDFIVGDFSFDFEFPSGMSSGYLAFLFARVDSSNKWFVQVDPGGSFYLGKEDSGNVTSVINGFWPDDTDNHKVRVTRDESDNWELFIDGNSQGTATDSYKPDVSSDRRRLGIRSQADNECRINQVNVKTNY